LKLHIQNRYKGGEIASRNNPKCYSKKNQKEITIDRKLSFSRKHLSLETAYSSLGILKNPINLLKIGTSGDVSSNSENSYLHSNFTILVKLNRPMTYWNLIDGFCQVFGCLKRLSKIGC